MEDAKPHTIVHRQMVIQWRDRHSYAAMESLNRAWRDFRPVIVKQIDNISWKDAITSPNAFIRDHVDPQISDYFKPIIAENIQDAKTSLETLFAAEWGVNTEIATSVADENHLQAALDVLQGVAPLAGGIAVGAAIPSMAMVSGTALLGLVATSTIKLPIVFGGLAIAGVGVATGAIKTSALRDKAKARMMAKIDSHVAQSLLACELDDSHPAILARLLDSYRTTATVALGDS